VAALKADDGPKSSRPRRVYLDTSAYLCVLLGEKGWERVAGDLADAELLSSVLLVLEAQRHLVRLARDGTLTTAACRACLTRVEHDVDRFVLRDLTLDLCRSGVLPVVSTPRSLDLVHLRTALWFHSTDRLDRFITMDESQADAARELGLPA
jgi:hypothetical protein